VSVTADEAPDDLVIAARLALFVLHSTIQEYENSQRAETQYFTEHGIKSAEEIVSHLARLASPVTCRLELRGGELHLSVKPGAAFPRTPNSLLGFLSGRRPPLRGDSQIVCRANGRLFVLPFAAFREWERSYQIEGNFSASADLADSEYARVQGFTREEIAGAEAVVVFGGGKPLRSFSFRVPRIKKKAKE
jgi:hypothetical protein